MNDVHSCSPEFVHHIKTTTLMIFEKHVVCGPPENYIQPATSPLRSLPQTFGANRSLFFGHRACAYSHTLHARCLGSTYASLKIQKLFKVVRDYMDRLECVRLADHHRNLRQTFSANSRRPSTRPSSLVDRPPRLILRWCADIRKRLGGGVQIVVGRRERIEEGSEGSRGTR
eukprot:938358_1